ncbi:hypothetical protein WAE58_22015 [Pedobacter panaciterrae]|uniref:TonB C-terminal domain-containing protein n=1 Tax=Pedobacter panaciterrae TaxID=363849 RepID=A0ABU8NSB6_9SPHI
MKKTTFFSLILILSFFYGYTQSKGELILPSETIEIKKIKQQTPERRILQIAVIKTIGKHLDSDLLFKTPKGDGYITSISLVFNMKGGIDTVYFAEKMSPQLKKILKPNAELVAKLKKILPFPDFNGKIVVYPILFKWGYDATLNYGEHFLNDFEGLWPNLDVKDQKKQIILLRPYINIFHKSEN